MTGSQLVPAAPAAPAGPTSVEITAAALHALARSQPPCEVDREAILAALLPHLSVAGRQGAWSCVASAERATGHLLCREWPASYETARRPGQSADDHYDRALARAELAVVVACRQAAEADDRAAHRAVAP